MYGNQKDQGPIFRFSLNGTAVTVTFGNAGEPDVKTRIRDILMESLEERFVEKAQAYIQ
jgi:hypothetical protein